MNIFSNKYIWLLGGLLSISVQGMGQEEINHLTGTLVSDTQDNPMGYTEVLVTDLSNNTVVSALTNEKGFFSIDLEKGTYILNYRELGEVLKQDTLNLMADTNLGRIHVPIINKTLQEVSVVAMKKIITFDKNRVIYSVKNSPYANGFNAKDV